MELDKSRTAKPLARPRGSASTISAVRRGGCTPGTDDVNYPHLPSTPEKPPTTRQRRASRVDEPGTADVEAQLVLHALTESEPKPKPRARRSIGISDDDTDAETITLKAVPEGALQVRSEPSGLETLHGTCKNLIGLGGVTLACTRMLVLELPPVSRFPHEA